MGKFKENKINFTKTSLSNLPLPTDGKVGYYYDKQVNGLGIMIFISGTKTFFLYRRVQGRPDKIKLGRFPEMSVEHARKKAYSIIGEIDKGIDPKAEKQKVTKDISFSELFTEFMEKHSKLHKRTWKDDEDKFRLYYSHFANRKISLITKADIIQLQTSISKNSGICTSNRALTLLSTVFTKAINWGWEGTNPCLGIKKFKEKSRDRFIQNDETVSFFKALDAEINEMFKDFFYILLLTGARKSNVQSMNWNDISFERAVWVIKETKNGEAMTVPLIPQAIGILEKRHKDRLSDWVFPSATSKSGHIEEPKKPWKRVLERAGIKDLRIHDLRRTLGSWQAAIGANSYIIGKSLGHKTQAATAIYARLNLDPVRASVGKAVDAIFVSAGKN
jgi:integrase